MKRRWIYILLLAGALAFPVKSVKLGFMRPVEVVYAYRTQNAVTVETDLGDRGRGSTVEEAVQNLKDSAPGEVYLDTARYLLVDEEAGECVEEFKTLLSGETKVCITNGSVDVKNAARYLDAHMPQHTLKNWNKAVPEKNEKRMKNMEKSS